VWIKPERLRRLRLNLDRLAERLASGLGCGGNLIRLIAGHLWVLGSRAVAAEPYALVLVRRSTERDLRTLLNHDGLRPYPRRVVLVVGPMPEAQDQPEPAPPLLPLESLVSDADGTLAVNDASLVALVLGDGRHRAANVVESIPVPGGSTWRAVSISMGDHRLIASIGLARYPRTFGQAGCLNSRTKNPDGQWKTLLKLAEKLGVWQVSGKRVPQALASQITRARRVLQALLPGIPGDPLPYADDDGCFRAAFSIHAEAGALYEFPQDGWEGVTIVWAGYGKLAIETQVTRRQGMVVRSRDEGEMVDAAVSATTGRSIVDLVQLGLADANGVANRAGRALEKLCRSRQPIPGRGDDSAMLELDGHLSRVFGTNQRPLEWDSGNGRWMACFEARLHTGA
jgi:hypothetical protein